MIIKSFKTLCILLIAISAMSAPVPATADEAADKADIFFKEGFVLLKTGKYTEAEMLYIEAIELYSSTSNNEDKIAKTNLYLAYVYLEGKEYRKAAKFRKKYTQFNIDKESTAIPYIRIPPQYPAKAAKKNLEGSVTILFDVKKNGRVKNAKVVKSSNKLFEKNALRAIKKSRYLPKLLDGEFVETKEVKATLRFQLAN